MKQRLIFAFTVLFTLFFINVSSGYAQEPTGEEVVSKARQYLGVPYKMGGSTPEGFDCSGFLLYVFNQFNISLPRTAADQATVGQAIDKENLQPGDIVYFINTYKEGVSHTGLYIGEEKFISATSSKGVKIDSINDPYYWGSRYAGARRVLENQMVPTGEFVDVPSGHWAKSAIAALNKQGIISGYDGGFFKPDQTIKRAEVAKMLSETFGLQMSASNLPVYNDVPEQHWAFPYITAASQKNYFTGYEGNVFKPNEPITRAEIASLFTRAFQLKATDQNVTFTDLLSSHWAYKDVQKLTANQIVSGYPDQTFKGSQQMTRAEFASALYRALNNK
jgi:peptidoglycan DL-endopeptidase CwlO